MADFNIQPVGTQIRPIQPMSLADMVNMARGVQAYQQAQQINPLEVQRAQTELSRLQQLTPEEVRKARAEANVAVQTQEPRISTAKSQSETALAQMQEAQLKTLRSYLSNTRSEVADLLKKPEITYDDVVNRFKTSLENTPADEKIKSQILSQGLSNIPKGLTSDQYRSLLAQQLVKTVSSESQLSTMFPSISMLGTGQSAVPITTGSALAVQTPGVPTGTPGIAMQPPPTTEIVDPVTGQRRLLGTMSSTAPNAPLLTSVGPAQAGTLEAAANVIKEDLPKTLSDAQAAPARIGIFQNIKKLTPDAFTGVTSERRQAVANLAQVLGIPAYQLESATTDELMKNTKLLQLAGGNTDAARALAEFANPNTKMTKEGITRVTDQLLGIEKMKLARSQYLGPAQNNATEYMQRKQAFDSVSDPRLFQEMTKEDAQKMWNSMSAKERSDILDMQRRAKQMGVLQ